MELESISKISDGTFASRFGRIGVLMGGPSSEREVSLRSGESIYATLKGLHLDAIRVDIETDRREENIQLICSQGIDCAFLALHGRFGEDGQIQEILESIDIPYTGSGVIASRLAMDKVASRKIFEARGLAVPHYRVFKKSTIDKQLQEQRILSRLRRRPRACTWMNAKKKLLGGMSLNGQAIPVGGITPEEYAEIIAREFRHGLGVGVNKGTTGICPWGCFPSLPLVVKPATHGSSIGLSIVDEIKDLKKAMSLAFRFDETVIVEEYIQGTEVTVGILQEQVLPAVEIIPKRRFFDYQAKYQSGMTEYVVPARIQGRLLKRVQDTALSAHRLLGCSGCSRVDMILNAKGIPFVLEINTIPGFTSTSLLPKSAKVAGIDFGELCLRLIQSAYEKKQHKST